MRKVLFDRHNIRVGQRIGIWFKSFLIPSANRDVATITNSVWAVLYYILFSFILMGGFVLSILISNNDPLKIISAGWETNTDINVSFKICDSKLQNAEDAKRGWCATDQVSLYSDKTNYLFAIKLFMKHVTILVNPDSEVDKISGNAYQIILNQDNFLYGTASAFHKQYYSMGMVQPFGIYEGMKNADKVNTILAATIKMWVPAIFMMALMTIPPYCILLMLLIWGISFGSNKIVNKRLRILDSLKFSCFSCSASFLLGAVLLVAGVPFLAVIIIAHLSYLAMALFTHRDEWLIVKSEQKISKSL